MGKRGWTPRFASAQRCANCVSFQYRNIKLEKSTRLLVQFEGVLLEAAPGAVRAPMVLDGKISAVVDPLRYTNSHVCTPRKLP